MSPKFLTIVGTEAEGVELAGGHLGPVQDLGVEGGGQPEHQHQPPDGHHLAHLCHPWRAHPQSFSNPKQPAFTFNSVKV